MKEEEIVDTMIAQSEAKLLQQLDGLPKPISVDVFEEHTYVVLTLEFLPEDKSRLKEYAAKLRAIFKGEVKQ